MKFRTKADFITASVTLEFNLGISGVLVSSCFKEARLDKVGKQSGRPGFVARRNVDQRSGVAEDFA